MHVGKVYMLLCKVSCTRPYVMCRQPAGSCQSVARLCDAPHIATLCDAVMMRWYGAALANLCMRSLAKDTTNWRNKQELLDSERSTLASLTAQLAELDEAGLAQGVADATAARDAAAEALAAAEHGVEAATRELAGGVLVAIWMCCLRPVRSCYLPCSSYNPRSARNGHTRVHKSCTSSDACM